MLGSKQRARHKGNLRRDDSQQTRPCRPHEEQPEGKTKEKPGAVFTQQFIPVRIESGQRQYHQTNIPGGFGQHPGS